MDTKHIKIKNLHKNCIQKLVYGSCRNKRKGDLLGLDFRTRATQIDK